MKEFIAMVGLSSPAGISSSCSASSGGEDQEIIDLIDQQSIMSWLPAHVLDEAFGLYHHDSSLTNQDDRNPLNDHNHNKKEENELGRRRGKHYYQHQFDNYALKFSGHPHLQSQRSSAKQYHNKPRYHHNHRASKSKTGGGPGMQAVFLDSSGGQNKKSSGTGVFIPRNSDGGADLEQNKKPACSPVLLPLRVVQALNIDVQGLGLQISPKRDLPKNTKRTGDGEHCVSSNILEENDRHISNDSRMHASSIAKNSQDLCSSPEIFLPKEWTY